MALRQQSFEAAANSTHPVDVFVEVLFKTLSAAQQATRATEMGVNSCKWMAPSEMGAKIPPDL